MIDLTLLSEIFRFLCLCVVMEKGSWTPSQVEVTASAKRPKEKTQVKPEWLKEWTISKGWIHNRSHLLTLGRENQDDSSSVSTEDVDDLISTEATEGQDLSLVFHQVCENYRENFPENPTKYSDLQLPEIYKERLLLGRDQEKNFLSQFWKLVKPKKKTESRDCKFTINQLYDHREAVQTFGSPESTPKPSRSRTTLGKNIALHNTLNSRTNLHEDPIYECSEENLSIYNNPIYAPSTRYYDFRSNHVCGSAFKYRSRPDPFKSRLKTEKCIIRHIKVRIMLSLRIGQWKRRARRADVTRSEGTHEEQRRIANGRNSVKIQNMRFEFAPGNCKSCRV
jgi:hypothetical protein